MPTKYKIFLGKGALPPYNPHQGASPLDPCEHLAHRATIQNGMTPMPKGAQGGGGVGAATPSPIFDDSRGK